MTTNLVTNPNQTQFDLGINAWLLPIVCVSLALFFVKWPAAVRYVEARYHTELPGLEAAKLIENANSNLKVQLLTQLQNVDRAVVFGLQELLQAEISKQQIAALQQAQGLAQAQTKLDLLREQLIDTKQAQSSERTLKNKRGVKGAELGKTRDGATMQTRSAPIIAKPTPFISEYALAPKLPLSSGDRVLFIGDSLMQGVSVHAIAAMKKQLPGIFTLDLARQSTGLAYPNFFDWPRTAELAIVQHKITTMVVFLGANDFYDMNVAGKRYNVGTPQWIIEYAAVVHRMVSNAHNLGVRVVWMEIPPMDKALLKDRVPMLNRAYASAVTAQKARWIEGGSVLANEQGGFAKFLPNAQGVTVQVRLDDGVHFTVDGQRRLTARLLSQFALTP